MILTSYVSIPFNIDKNIRLLICSDGLTDMLTDDEIRSKLENFSTANDFVNAAIDKGGRDNITCIVLDLKGE